MTYRTIAAFLFAAAALLLVAVDAASAQDAESGASGRLPPYYKEVVSESQKKSIYQIQSQYDDKLEALEKRFDELTAELKKVRGELDDIRFEERDAIEKVLTPKQLAQVKRMQAEAQSRLAQELLKAAEEAAKRAEALAQPE